LNTIYSVSQLNFTYKYFSSWEEISDYVSSPGYGYKDGLIPGVCMGFSIVENNSSDYEVRLMFNDKDTEED
jgi:hypothetical protein